MKVFFDMEFTGLHQKTTPISLGLVAENGCTFYGEFSDYDVDQVDDWLKENVIANLMLTPKDPTCFEHISSTGRLSDSSVTVYGGRDCIAKYLSIWLSGFDQVEMWGDCLAYDWVLFCELFGGGVECLPQNVYYIPFDICTLFKMANIDPDIDRIKYAEMAAAKHVAIDDAVVICRCYERAIRFFCGTPVMELTDA